MRLLDGRHDHKEIQEQSTMAATEQNTSSSRRDIVKELLTEARVESLNAALADRGITGDRIIAILHVAGQTMANPTPSQFRVLYRAS
jgi:hypothetical protein